MSDWTPTPDLIHPRRGAITYACERPEDPSESLVHDYRCRACWLHAKALVLSGKDSPRKVRDHATGETVLSTRAREVEIAAEVHGWGAL